MQDAYNVTLDTNSQHLTSSSSTSMPHCYMYTASSMLLWWLRFETIIYKSSLSGLYYIDVTTFQGPIKCFQTPDFRNFNWSCVGRNIQFWWRRKGFRVWGEAGLYQGYIFPYHCGENISQNRWRPPCQELTGPIRTIGSGEGRLIITISITIIWCSRDFSMIH